MKTQFRTSRFIMGVTVICALAIASTASAKNPKDVVLNISDNKLIMKSKKGANDCEVVWGEYRKNGCIQLKHNEKSEIYIQLQENTKCTLESGTDWKLNAVYLGGFDFENKPTVSEGFGFDDTAEDDYDKVQSDFNIANRTSGLVTPVDKKDHKITINDENEYKYNVWYKIEAICEREDGKTAHTTSYDPRVKNGGTD